MSLTSRQGSAGANGIETRWSHPPREEESTEAWLPVGWGGRDARDRRRIRTEPGKVQRFTRWQLQNTIKAKREAAGFDERQ